jgi:hypothetical protein
VSRLISEEFRRLPPHSPTRFQREYLLGYCGDSALNSALSFIEIVRRLVSDGLHRETGGFRRRWRIPKWRATVDEDGQYCLAVAL